MTARCKRGMRGRLRLLTFDKSNTGSYNVSVSNQHIAYPVEELKRAALDAPTTLVTGNRDLVQFVRVWQSAQSIKVVSQKTNIPPQTASMIAVRMRKYGIPLKPFQRRGWNNRLLRELGRYCNTTGQPAHFVVGPMRRRIAFLEAQVEKLEQQLRARK